jgi:serine/threonine protein kinase
MYKESLESFILSRHNAFFTKESAKKAANAGLSQTDIVYLIHDMEMNRGFLGNDKSYFFDRIKTHLNQLYGDFNAFFLSKKLEHHNLRYFEDDTERLESIKQIINESSFPPTLKNVLLKRVDHPNDGYREINGFLDSVKRFQGVGCYILSEKCAEKGNALQEKELKYLVRKLGNVSHYSEAVYDMLVSKIITDGVSNAIADFKEMRTNPNPNHVEAIAAELARENAVINNAESDESVEFLDPVHSKQFEVLLSTHDKPRQSWVKGRPQVPNEKRQEAQVKLPDVSTIKESRDVVTLPYLHNKIDPADLLDNKIADKKGKVILEVGNDSFTAYRKGRLGGGSFGAVILAQNDQSGEWIALKVIPLRKMSGSITGEVDSLKAAKDFVFQTRDSENFYIGMKLHKGVELLELLNDAKKVKNPARLSEAQRLFIAKKALKSTVDLHYDTKTMVATTTLQGVDKELRLATENRMIHRDIKPENMMIDSTLNAEHIDFGFAGFVTRNHTKITDSQMGSPFFMAPEIHGEDRVKYGEKTEVYALGVSMLDIFDVGQGNSPVLGEKASLHDPSLIDLISRMIDKNPKNRPTVIEAYSQLNKIINSINDKNRLNPVGLKAYAVSIEDFDKAKRSGSEKEFIQAIVSKGVNSIAFYSTNPSVEPNLLIVAQREFEKKGIIHVVPDLYCNQHVDVNLQNIEKYYNRTFGTQATQLHTKDSQLNDLSTEVQQQDIAVMLDKYSKNNGGFHNRIEIESAAKTIDRHQALIQLTEFVIQKMSESNAKEFYNNGGKQLINKTLKLPGIDKVLAESHSRSSANRATLLKGAVLPQIHHLMRGSIVKKIDGLVKTASEEKAAPQRVSRSF